MKSVCIIPARGGSKRIPRKNIKDFLGKPIIAYSIESALRSGLFEDVIVSTDDSEIAEVAKKYGASVPFIRSEENSNDFASTLSVIQEVVQSLKGIGKTYDFFCCLYPTAPFVTEESLHNGFKKIVTLKYDVVLPLVPFSFPPQRGIIINANDNIEFKYPENVSKRSQDLEKIYHDAGQFYWGKSMLIEERNSLFSNNCSWIELTEMEVQDIDSPIDWKIAELKYSLKINK